MTISRRDFIHLASAMGAALAWSGSGRASRVRWREQREYYPEGVASGDPDAHSVILWTRRPYARGDRHLLTAEIAEDEEFRRVVAQVDAPVSAAADWTARVLVGHLKPAHVYWFRFTDSEGNGSRIGRTITAPADDDQRPINFAFVSCQSINDGKLNAYRRMIFEDERAPSTEQLTFVLHLGDFIYEIVQYPDENPQRYDRTVYEVARIPDAGRHGDFHFPLNVEGYRAVYRGYLADPDLQDARARWPFISMWDNHEFSWQGWQSIMKDGDAGRPGQTVKVAANQAWFEYIPSRLKAPSGSLEEFGPPAVKNVPIERWDENGLGDEPNNLVAIRSLIGYRSVRYGRHLDLIITDQHSYRSSDPSDYPELASLSPKDLLGFFPEDVMQALDGGRAFNGGHPPAEFTFADVRTANPRKDAPPQTILGAEQKAWFKDRLRNSKATWKIWANSEGTPDWRTDLQNLPATMAAHWPHDTFGILGNNDYGTAYAERAEIYDLVRDARITGFAIISGDRHAFEAGYAAKALPPAKFEPVGVTFTGASLSSVGILEAFEFSVPKTHPLRPLFLADRPGAAHPEGTFNMLLRLGVKSCLEYAKSFDLGRAKSLSNPSLAPHLQFQDLGGHGYAKVRLTMDEMRTEFVCIPRPIKRSDGPDGGPLRYRVAHTTKLWSVGHAPLLTQTVLEGDPGLSV